MKDFHYHLSVHDCRAIKLAEIDLSEITVLTGVNASGKSTLARMFRRLCLEDADSSLRRYVILDTRDFRARYRDAIGSEWA